MPIKTIIPLACLLALCICLILSIQLRKAISFRNIALLFAATVPAIPIGGLHAQARASPIPRHNLGPAHDLLHFVSTAGTTDPAPPGTSMDRARRVSLRRAWGQHRRGRTAGDHLFRHATVGKGPGKRNPLLLFPDLRGHGLLHARRFGASSPARSSASLPYPCLPWLQAFCLGCLPTPEFPTRITVSSHSSWSFASDACCSTTTSMADHKKSRIDSGFQCSGKGRRLIARGIRGTGCRNRDKADTP